MERQQRPPRRSPESRRRNASGEARQTSNEARLLPVLPIRNAVILPDSITPLYVEHEKTRRAIDAAVAHGGKIFAVTQIDERFETTDPAELHLVGVEALVEKSTLSHESATSVTLRALRRAQVVRYLDDAVYLRAEVMPLADSPNTSAEVMALVRTVRMHFEMVANSNGRITNDALMHVLNAASPGVLADAIALALDLLLPDRQRVLETLDPAERLALVDTFLYRELEVIEIESRIQQAAQAEIEKGHEEYYLREQIKVIQRKLTDRDPALGEHAEVREKLATLGMPAEVHQRALRELDRLESMPSMAPEYTILRTYVDWLATLPWSASTTDRMDLVATARILDSHHYGLQKVKERLIEFVAVRALAPQVHSPILCFVGPPGVGKTSLGKSIAEALGRTFARVSLGGVHDEAEIRGHRRTYVGALPGRILQTMRRAGVVNPLFVLDEIDKLTSDYRGDPASALLEVLDPEQNTAFSDHYLEVDYDLSKVIFILTANDLRPIPPALLDRMEVIELAGYSEEEKSHIATQYLIPRQMQEHGLTASKVDLRPDAVQRIAREYTYEAGVRNLEREIGSVMRKVARRVVEGKRGKTMINAARVPEYLGPQRTFRQEAEEHDQVGVAMGVAWNPAGGEIMPVEVASLEGKGILQLTGQLGDVLRESAQAAISYTRSRACALGIAPNFHETRDVHIHLPMGGVKKDGPSAGVTIAVALISALTGRAICRDLAMTGEITLRGRVLPVGGVKEKAYAAYRAGLTIFALPRKNLPDLDDLPPDIRAALHLVPLDSVDDALNLALRPACPATEPGLGAVATLAHDPAEGTPARLSVLPDVAPGHAHPQIAGVRG